MTQQIDAINGYLEAAGVNAKRSVDVAREVLEGKDHMTVTFRQEIAEPKRSESPKRAHVFYTTDGFCAYLKKFGSANVVILADPASGCARAVLNETSPCGFETVSFEPMIHPMWKPWRDHLAFGDLSVKTFAKFVAGQGHVIRSPDPKQLLMVLSQVRLSKNVTVESGMGARSLNGVMVETSVQGKSATQMVDLPERIVVHCPMFWDTEPEDIAVDVLVDVNGDEVNVLLTSSDAESKRIQQIETMLCSLVTGLPDAVVTFGNVEHEPWAYVCNDARK
jgi:hypothetical protein